jgi:hypothetical protein
MKTLSNTNGFTSTDAHEFSPTFWRTSQYTSYDEANAQGGAYEGEDCYGYSAFVDAMCCVLAAATCFDANANADLRVRLIIDGRDFGDFRISDAS